ncbi:MAG: AgmX/PglI C-terminal domain-containing protein, partial [Bdellovibrionales bacterium]
GALSVGNTGTADVGVLEEETEVEGGLDKEAIARVIRSQLGQIRYCYERQLSANPDLYGKILVKFTIGAAGSVTAQTIGNTSLNNAMVEGCILRRIAGWQFPNPKGGTNVLVSYPFLFKSTR